MSSSYRRDRYLDRTSEKKSKRYVVLTFMSIFLITMLSGGIVYIKQKQFAAELEGKKLLIEKYTDELAWLRTINPIKGDYIDLKNTVVKTSSLYPGWVTRVYPIPESVDSLLYSNDVGTFILNESKFSMASHQHHGITQQNKSMYILNALLPSRVDGRHQVGIKLELNEETDRKNSKGMTKMASCYSQLFVNQKRIINKKINMFGGYSTGSLHTGEVNLQKGLYPISAKIYCDKNSDFTDRDLEVSIMFRNPEQQSFQDSRFNVFHIYNPNMQLASL